MASPTSQPKKGDWYSTGTGNNTEVYVWSGSQWSARSARSGRPSGSQWDPAKAAAFKNPSTGATGSGSAGSTEDPNSPETLSFKYLATGVGPGETATLSYPQALTNMTGNVDYVQFRFKKYNAPFGLNRQNGTNAQGAASGSRNSYNYSAQYLDNSNLPLVLMYMPEDIASRYGAEWGGKSIQNATRGLLEGFAAPGAKVTEMIKNLTQTIGQSKDSIFTAAVSEGLAAMQKVGQGEGLNLNDVFGSTKGIVINPNTELLFVGFNLRSFDLNFKMVARNQPEAAMIRDIITTFKKATLPSQINDSPTGKKDERVAAALGNDDQDRLNFIQVPDLVEITFMHNGRPHEFISQYKPCAITEIGVNYTADGSYATYRDGEPVAINLSLRFAETKLVYREDVRYGGVSF